MQGVVAEAGGGTTLQWLGLAVEAAVPVVIVILGFLGKKYASELERRRRRSEVEVLWRLEVFRELLASLNQLYCYFTYQGSWSEMSPGDATVAKRSCDRIIYMNRFLWSQEFICSYEVFSRAAFVENRGRGLNFQFRANVERHKENPQWKSAWEDRFVPEKERIRRMEFIELYDRVVDGAVRDLGVIAERSGA